jgi:hypothetical protein
MEKLRLPQLPPDRREKEGEGEGVRRKSLRKRNQKEIFLQLQVGKSCQRLLCILACLICSSAARQAKLKLESQRVIEIEKTEEVQEYWY